MIIVIIIHFPGTNKSMNKKYIPAVAFFMTLCVVFITGCTADRVYLQDDPSAGWYPTKIENELIGQDPLEGWNRSMFAVTDVVMTYLGDPLSRVYGSIMPRPGVDLIENACQNLEYPTRLITTLGTAEWGGAWDETCRFFINTTIGIAGLFDPAKHWFHIYSTESDFGQMFAIWGIGPGGTFMLPLIPTVTTRDTVGWFFDMAFDIRTYLPYTYLATFNRFIVMQQRFSSIADGSADRYKTMRFLLAMYRETQNKRWAYKRANKTFNEYKAILHPETGEFLPDPPLPVKFVANIPKPQNLNGNWIAQPEYYPQSPALESLRSVFTAPIKSNDYWFLPHTLFNRDFYRKIDIRSLRLTPDGRKLRYAFFAQPEHKDEKNPPPPEKLAILIPGVGSVCDSKSTLSVAEKYYNAGCNVIALDCPFSWQGTMEGPGNGQLPGYIPEDASRIRTFLKAVYKDLKENNLISDNRANTILTGWSFGALCAAHVMQQESSENNPLGIRKCILINPPAGIGNAMNAIDRQIALSSGITAEQLRAKIPELTGEIMTLSQVHLPEMSEEISVKNKITTAFSVPRISEQDALFISATALRGGIRDILFSRHREKPFACLKNKTDIACRNSLYDELDRIDFKKYAEDFLLPELKEQKIGRSYDELEKQAGLYSLESFLKNNPDICCLHVWNDFLISEQDRTWLDKTFGKRIFWFDAGGHLGNQYLSRVHKTLLNVSGEKMPDPSVAGK